MNVFLLMINAIFTNAILLPLKFSVNNLANEEVLKPEI